MGGVVDAVVDVVVGGLDLVTGGLFSAGMDLVSKTLAPELDNKVGTSPGDRKQVIRSAAAAMVGIKGVAQIGGVLFFAEDVKSGDYLHLGIAICGHRKPAGVPVITGVNRVFMDDEEVPLGESHDGKLYVHVYDGSQQTIDDIEPELKNLPSWRNDMVGRGICFAHVKMKYDTTLYPSSVPAFVFEVRSIAEDAVSYTSDRVLEYLRDDFGATDDEIDIDSFNQALQICKESVLTADTDENGDQVSESRYCANGTYDYNETHKNILGKLIASCGGQLTYMNGTFGLQVGAYNGPADFVLTEDDMVGDVSVQPMPDRRSLINIVKGTYVWPEAKFQEVDFPEVRSEELIARDGEELDTDLDLEFVHSPYQAQRLAQLKLSKARLTTLKVPCNLRGYECFLGRNIKVRLPHVGFDDQECIVEGWEMAHDKGVTLTLRTDSPDLYTDIIGRIPLLPPNINLPNPRECDPVTGFRFSEMEQDNVWQVRLAWDHANPGSIYEYRITLELNDNGQWVEKGTAVSRSTFWQFTAPVSGIYRATIVAVNRFDVLSNPVSNEFTINIPGLTVMSLAVTAIDNQGYPCSAWLSADVAGVDAFPAGSVTCEWEAAREGEDWLPVVTGGGNRIKLSGLDEGRQRVRVRAIPPYGIRSSWVETLFTVYAAEVPESLTFTADDSHQRWGKLAWSGAGQSWDIELRNTSGVALWNTTTTERSCWLDWQNPGSYTAAVRTRAGGTVTKWNSLGVTVDDLKAPTNLTFTADYTGASGGVLGWTDNDDRMELCEMELLSGSRIIHTAMTGSQQTMLPVLAPGNYTARVRCRWRDSVSSWATLALDITENITPPSDLVFRVTDESAWLGELTWATGGHTSELEIINDTSGQAITSVTLLNGYYHVPLLAVGGYTVRVRTVGTWSKSDWVITTIAVGKPAAPANLNYRETADNPASAGRLEWDASPTASISGYDVALLNSGGQVVLSTRVQGTWFDIGNIANGSYTAAVRAVSLLASEVSDSITTDFAVAALGTPVNLQVSEKLVESGTGFTSEVTLKWQSNDSRTQSYDVEFRPAGETGWSGFYSGPSVTASRQGLTTGDYRFRVRARAAALESGWADISLNVRGMETAPPDVTNLQLSGITGQMAQLSWDTITAPDVINGGSVHVRHTPHTGTSATWATAVPLTERLPGTTTLVQVPLLPGTYLVKCVNPADYWSENAAAVVSNMSALVGYNRIVERQEPDAWPGDKNKAVIDAGGSLTLADNDSNDDPPYYIMDAPLDLGGVFTVRLHLECDGTVYERDTIDDRTDPIDSWPMFDGAQPGGTSLQYYVSCTNDNPADAGAVWTGWTRFFVGEFRARAFRLKVALINPTPAAAGTLAGLKLIADVPDRTEKAQGMSAPAAGLPVSYQRKFMAPAMIAITAHAMTAGDYYQITSSTADGFTIRFYNNAGQGVARTFDYSAVSYGEG